MKNILFYLFIAITPITAFAEGEQEGSFLSLLPLVLLFVVFYFVLIRPQQKKTKLHKKMTEELKKGDEVITFGGILARIVELDENFLSLEVADEVIIKVQRSGVATLMPKGTYKSS